MHESTLYSLRLGFTARQAPIIKKIGVKNFVKSSLNYIENSNLDIHRKLPGNFSLYKEENRISDSLSEAEKKALAIKARDYVINLRYDWIKAMTISEFPLREKMTLFWHNHFVSAQQKVNNPYYIHKQNQLFRTNAFGNYKTLTKAILKDEAMLYYLDNNKNKASSPNENLSRELLELFTLGIGNYTEDDIREGAKALAGLFPTNEGTAYNHKFEDNSIKKYLGKTGNLKSDDLVDAIFEHPKIGYLLVTKLLKYYITDTPSEILVNRYVKKFKSYKFEIAPLIKLIFSEIDIIKFEGAMIKDPLTFILQSIDEYAIIDYPKEEVTRFLSAQNMELFNPPNVKGWLGARDWISSEKLIQRFKTIDNINTFINKKIKSRKVPKEYGEIQYDISSINNIEVIKSFSDKMIYKLDENLSENLESILTYDFYKDKTIDLNPTLRRLIANIMKTPIYQLK